jgi:hypothetical protein
MATFRPPMKLTSHGLESFKHQFESISLLTGEELFKELVAKIGETLGADALWITES